MIVFLKSGFHWFRCVGMADGDYMPGTCSSINPCYENPCSENEICVIKRRVCLPSLERICPQFVCGKYDLIFLFVYIFLSIQEASWLCIKFSSGKKVWCFPGQKKKESVF